MRTDIEFLTADGVCLRGWHYVPEGSGPFPTVVMAHGFAGVKEMHLDKFAERFVDAGLAVVVYDHRRFGSSDGTPRQELDPWLQVRDFSEAVTFAATLPETDPERIGAWGTSFAGGHVLVLAGEDRRIRAVACQVPLISGSECARRLVPAPMLAQVQLMQQADRVHRMKGGEPAMIPVVSEDPMAPSVLSTPDAWPFFEEHGLDTPFINEVTLRSMEYAGGYEPGLLVERISPTPLLMIVGDNDLLCPTDLQLDAYARAREPKRLVLFRGGHFDPYVGEAFEQASAAAAAFFAEHLA
jgi:fermentation-respiration switch protein FrsA (DUF1100 family)